MSETGYIYAIICAVVLGMTSVAMGFCLERLLTGREDRISRRKRMALWMIVGVGTQSIKCLIPMPDIYLSFGNPIVLNLCGFFILKYCYSDRGVIKLLHVAMLVIQNVLADVLYQSLWGMQINVEAWRFVFQTKAMAEACAVIGAISIFVNILYTVIVLNTRKKKREKTSPLWIAIMLIFLLILAAIRMMRSVQVQVSRGFSNSYFIFICVFAIVEFAILMLFLSQSEKKAAQEEKQRTLEEVQKLQHIMEIEKLRYEQIEARREEMAKIRHDYNNVITSVMYLIENGRTDEAEEIMKDLSERISQTGEIQ